MIKVAWSLSNYIKRLAMEFEKLNSSNKPVTFNTPPSTWFVSMNEHPSDGRSVGTNLKEKKEIQDKKIFLKFIYLRLLTWCTRKL